MVSADYECARYLVHHLISTNYIVHHQNVCRYKTTLRTVDKVPSICPSDPPNMDGKSVHFVHVPCAPPKIMENIGSVPYV